MLIGIYIAALLLGYLFGSVLTVSAGDVRVVAGLAVFIVVVVPVVRVVCERIMKQA